jgi:hypothetical protein
MFGSSTLLEVAIVVAAMGWPLAAGLLVVLWSKARAAERLRREASLQGHLKGLYRGVAEQPVPERLALVLEALEEGEALAARATEAPAKTPQPAG